MFQFTLPCRERPTALERPVVSRRFNSRSRGGSDLAPGRQAKTSAKFQFTLPRGERRGLRAVAGEHGTVSIHAPAGGATSERRALMWRLRFQFTLPCRERPVPSSSGITVSRFQFTLPCRERPQVDTMITEQRQFQFTLPCRERLGALGNSLHDRQFQFTLPCRERLVPHRRSAGRQSFNSRSRVGSDASRSAFNPGPSVFQFTLPCRERHRRLLRVLHDDEFQFTLPCRERHPAPSRHASSAPGFNSRSRVGSDIKYAIEEIEDFGFNSRSRVGSDAGDAPRVAVHPPFQFTLPCRERLTSQ